MKRLLLILLAAVLGASCGPHPSVLWTFRTGAPIYGGSVVIGNNVVFGGMDHYLYSLDCLTGKLAWKTNLHERIFSTPFVDREGKSLFVGNGRGEFFSVETATGRIAWSFAAKDLIKYDACGDENGVYFGDAGGYIHRLDLDGKPVWSRQIGCRTTGGCRLYKDLVLAGSWDEHLYAINKESGQVAWKFYTTNYVYGIPAVTGNTAYVTTHNKVFALNADTGRLLHEGKSTYVDWPILLGGYLWTLDADGLSKRSLDTRVLAHFQYQGAPSIKPAIHDNYLVVCTDTNLLHAISTDMKTVWKFKGSEQFMACGSFQGDVYYVGDRNGIFYALKLPK
jgi:outer membrane protein assembly factor BamB